MNNSTYFYHRAVVIFVWIFLKGGGGCEFPKCAWYSVKVLIFWKFSPKGREPRPPCLSPGYGLVLPSFPCFYLLFIYCLRILSVIVGCDICRCAPEPKRECPEVICTMFCEHGFQTDPETGIYLCLIRVRVVSWVNRAVCQQMMFLFSWAILNFVIQM